VETAWEDLVVPKKVQWELRQVLLHARYRLGETSDRFGRKKGYRLLLSGLPGTGKSMCAEALATTLDRPLVKLDLSSVLSKWLGETEKLLAQVFDVAEAANAVLVLDEAESLLRQRGGDGKGGGMGALSTGVAYLLTRLDSYTGVLVATTNRTRDLDEAFFRRFDDFVILPIPDRPTRVRLWSTFLGDGAGDLDLEFIGGHFAISGGLIRSAAIRADAWRVGMELPMETPLVLASLARELEKNDRSSVEAMVEPYRKAVMELLDGPLEDER
jgi:SpoVK/Ycf46/Vps4 family AAA+-type ATPase